MKRLYTPLLAFFLVLLACNNNKTKEGATTTAKDSADQVSPRAGKTPDAASAMEQVKDDLAKLTPLSADQLKALLPEQIKGGSRSDIDVNNNTGASAASTEYKINDSTSLQLNIVDCAGPGGSGIYATQYLGMFTIREEDEEEYSRSIGFNGGKALENCKKKRKECSLTYFSGGRFLVSVEGNMGIDELKDLAKGLNIK